MSERGLPIELQEHLLNNMDNTVDETSQIDRENAGKETLIQRLIEIQNETHILDNKSNHNINTKPYVFVYFLTFQMKFQFVCLYL